MAGVIKTMWKRTTAARLPEMPEIETFGADGEEMVYRLLCESFSCVVRNVIVPHKKKYLEKDLMVLHKGSLFVIEVKNWKGEIGCEGGDFYQLKDNGTKKTLKSPVGTTNQFTERMRDFYGIETPVFGMVVFCEPDCRVTLPESMDGVALLPIQKMIPFIKNAARAAEKGKDLPDPARILRCTRFYDRDREFCKGILADCFIDLSNDAGEIVRINTVSLSYLSVEAQPLLLRDKIHLTYINGATDYFYNTDTVLTVANLDGTYQKIALNRVRHIVF